MPSLLCESPQETSPVEGSFVFFNSPDSEKLIWCSWTPSLHCTVTFHETLPVVGSLMFLHVMWPWKLLATPWAQKLFLSCVDFSFFTMVTWSQEHHATLFASKLFLSCDDERTHMGGKPFKCTKCDKSCPLSSYLKAHEKIHSGEKPFKCTNCNKSCSTSSYLNTHPLRRDSI